MKTGRFCKAKLGPRLQAGGDRLASIGQSFLPSRTLADAAWNCRTLDHPNSVFVARN